MFRLCEPATGILQHLTREQQLYAASEGDCLLLIAYCTLKIHYKCIKPIKFVQNMKYHHGDTKHEVSSRWHKTWSIITVTQNMKYHHGDTKYEVSSRWHKTWSIITVTQNMKYHHGDTKHEVSSRWHKQQQIMSSHRQFQKIATSDCLLRHVCLSIRLTARNNSAPTGRTWMEFLIFRESVIKIQVSLKPANNNRHFTCSRPIYSADHIWRGSA
jgi:hypothetical protein